MELIRIPHIVQDTCRQYRQQGRKVGFVPTMGALHRGHISLIRRARAENDITVASIFVNPLQFAPSEDLETYPRDIENDINILEHEDIDILFLPDTAHLYSPGFSTYITVEKISDKLCGGFRNGHFRGVATIIAKLFNIVMPTSAYFGQKDYQQTTVIKKMVSDLNFDIDINVCPTIREENGLAISSRNLYLDDKQLHAALSVYKSLIAASDAVKSGIINTEAIKNIMNSIYSEEMLITHVEYASVYDPESLDEMDDIKGDALIAVAVRLGTIRLIDNMLVTV
jgi:pantoate--beta-alanine ligase